MATRDPSEDRDTEKPSLSLLASPLISTPICVHAPEVYSYTLTCPELLFPPELLNGAPHAIRDPSDDRDTE